jgi:hypothetical protein
MAPSSGPETLATNSLAPDTGALNESPKMDGICNDSARWPCGVRSGSSPLGVTAHTRNTMGSIERGTSVTR